jgi:hypothetical protein
MKGKVIISVCAFVLLALSSAWAADVAGKWTATIPAAQGQGESTITFVLKMDGEKLTGTVNNTQAPGDVQIAEGKVSGDEISFSLMRDIGGTSTKVLWKGKISGDEIKFTRTTQSAAAGAAAGGAATEVTAKRVK